MPRFLCVVLVGGLVFVPGAAEDAKPEAAKMVNTQAAALQEAKDVDLKLLEKADRVVIEPGGRAKKESVTLKGDDVPALRKTLAVESVKPSGGEVAATLTFYRGDTSLRSVWVYKGGEWGFLRPGVSWTTGSSAELWKLVGPHVK